MRQVFPEKLDSLPHDDPAALRSRAELRVINQLMGNHRWLMRELKLRLDRHQEAATRILELGAGDGEFARGVWQAGVVLPARWEAVDLAPAPLNWPTEAHWHQGNLFLREKLPEAGIIVANLFLHHFEPVQLALLGKMIPGSCRVFIACEPARRLRHVLQGRVLSVLLGLSEVTHHDMLVSIKAGFLGDELAGLLGLVGWKTQVALTTLGAYRFVAWR